MKIEHSYNRTHIKRWKDLFLFKDFQHKQLEATHHPESFQLPAPLVPTIFCWAEISPVSKPHGTSLSATHYPPLNLKHLQKSRKVILGQFEHTEEWRMKSLIREIEGAITWQSHVSRNEWFDQGDMDTLYEQRTKPIVSAKGHCWNGRQFWCVLRRSWGFGEIYTCTHVCEQETYLNNIRWIYILFLSPHVIDIQNKSITQ